MQTSCYFNIGAVILKTVHEPHWGPNSRCLSSIVILDRNQTGLMFSRVWCKSRLAIESDNLVAKHSRFLIGAIR